MVGLGAQTLGMSTDFEQEEDRDFPGGPMVKTSPSNSRRASLISGQGSRIHMAQGQKTKNIKQKQYYDKFSKD